MTRIHAEASTVVDAAPEIIYEIIRDYNSGHPHILSEQYFSDLQIEEGGLDDGTVVRFTTKLAGGEKRWRVRIDEVEPGHKIAERDLNSDKVTTFTVSPSESGRSLVKIETDRTASPGLLRKVYQAELRQLGEFSASFAARKAHAS